MKDFTKEKKNIYLIDTTLRDGAQAARINFSYSEKLEIAKLLFDCNIDEVEAGIPAAGEKEIEFINNLIRIKPFKTKISVWCRNNLSDINHALDTDAEIIHISIFCSEILQKAFNKNFTKQIEDLKQNIKPVIDSGKMVSVGFQDVFRTPERNIINALNAISDTSIFRIRLADSCGCALPDDCSKLIKSVKKVWGNKKIDFHAHNDCGLSAANSISAFSSGADSVSVTVNGIGERAGNTSLSDIASVALITDLFNTGLNYRNIKALSDAVSRYSHFSVSPFAPLIGSHIFEHKAGIHVSALLNDPKSYQPYPNTENPCSSGESSANNSGIDTTQTNKFLFGQYSSMGCINGFMKHYGHSLSQETAALLKQRIDEHAAKQKTDMDGSTLISIYNECVAGGPNER
ncbi:MAG: hypothetical protein JXK07_13645 [Spirochaetes bacterium]|nr:hypothetical protein [Spirochaetota bacterium]MBN2771911.1 hypothetical protein [Spirochaetota bacterium]